ncbi:MAG: Arc family DNA-binding protein [Roseiflexaceae bacterium]
MNISNFLTTIKADLMRIIRLGGPEFIEKGEIIGDAMAPAMQQRLIEQVTMLVSEYNRQQGRDALALQLTPDEIVLVDRGVVQAAPEPIGELDARFALRLPADLKERIDQRAAQEGISANSWMVRVLSQEIQQQQRGATHTPPIEMGRMGIGSKLRGRGRS